MPKIVKIVTDCNFVGCENIRYIKFNDNVTEEYLHEVTEDFASDDIGAYGNWEIVELTEEELEEDGEQVEDWTE